MIKLEEIEQAVSRLSPDEMAKFRNWFEERDARFWDEQLEHDAKSGKLDDMANQALADHNDGRTKKL